jgi:hypothetical protein
MARKKDKKHPPGKGQGRNKRPKKNPTTSRTENRKGTTKKWATLRDQNWGHPRLPANKRDT